MKLKIQPLDQLNDAALNLLMRELGIANTARFLQQFSTGSGNYTEDRKAFYKDRTLDDLIQEIGAGQRRCRG